MTFVEYLASKKIDHSAFRQADADRCATWEKEFSEIHPASFTQRHLFQINNIRRRFPLAPSEIVTTAAPAKAIPRPKIP